MRIIVNIIVILMHFVIVVSISNLYMDTRLHLGLEKNVI